MNTFNLTLDLSKGRNVNPIRIRQGDLNGTEISALIFDHGAPADLTGLTAQFVMELPDGEHYYRKAATVSGNTVTVTINEAQAASVTGRTTRAYFQLLQGSTVKASTGSVTVDVLPDALEGHTVPADYDSAIQDAIDNLDAAVENLPATVEGVLEDHPEWTTTVQDGAISRDKLASDLTNPLDRLMYRLSNMLTATPAEAEVVTVADAAQTPMAGLTLYGRSTQDGTPTPDAPVAIESVTGDSEGNISLLARGFNQWDGAYSSTGNYLNANGVTSTDAEFDITDYIPVIGGQTYYVKGLTGSSPGLCWYDANKEYMGGLRNFDLLRNTPPSTFTVPSGAAYVRSTVPKANASEFCINVSDPARNGTYQPYASTVTPVPIDGHELRSLPDGTRDELTVDERGHAVLVQRVGSVDLGTLDWSAISSEGTHVWRTRINNLPDGAAQVPSSSYTAANAITTKYAAKGFATISASDNGYFAIGAAGDGTRLVIIDTAYSTVAAFAASIDGVCMLYQLATPVTHDLGLVDPIPLVGPDLTAQPIPDTTMALTYERDLDTTLARLEAAIAAIA